ncbi:MAG: HDOD domain-containing protein [Acidimicrobiia bacterium]
MSVQALFIDDDPRVLAEFEQLVSSGSLGIDATIASSPEEGLNALRSGTYEVIVAGAGSPTDKTVGVLREAASNHPAVARLLVTSDRNASRSGLAEQYLWRPFDADKLRIAVLAATHLRGRVTPERLAALVNGSTKIPTLPDIYVKIQEELRSSDPSMAKVGLLVKNDPAISVKVLQTVNSAMFGLRNEVGDVAQATALLGLNTITSLVLAVGVFQQASGLDRKLIEELWQESLRVSAIARRIASAEGLDRRSTEESQLAGLLHDIGELVLFQNWRNDYLEISTTNRLDDERKRFGATHADLGGYLCALWDLPSEVIRAVANHHIPSAVPASTVTATTVVHVARALVDAGGDHENAAFDTAHLEQIDAYGRCEVWAKAAQEA